MIKPGDIINSKIAGVTYKNDDGTKRQDLLLDTIYNQKLYLVREPENKYDKNAIAIYNYNHDQIGYVTSGLAVNLAKAMDDGFVCIAKAIELTGEKPIGCNIEIKVYDSCDKQIDIEEKEKNTLKSLYLAAFFFFLIIIIFMVVCT